MYCTYFAEMDPKPGAESISCRTVNVYRDPEVRPANTIAWQPEGNHFAITYIDMNFKRETCGPLTAYIWDVETPSSPDQVITPPCLLFDLQFNPRDNKQLIGGLLSGQVAHWDLRSGMKPVDTSPPHEAHRDLVRKVLFNNSKSGQEFFSSGPDGVCKWWDIRYFTEPTDVMIMDLVTSANDEQSMAHANGVCSLEFEPTIPTRFMVGTENGLVIGKLLWRNCQLRSVLCNTIQDRLNSIDYYYSAQPQNHCEIWNIAYGTNNISMCCSVYDQII